jgi:hypothetical protein
MSQQSSEPLSKHELFFGGFLSRYAPQCMLFAVFFVIGIGLTILGVRNPENKTLLPGVLSTVGGLLWLIPLPVGLFRRARAAEVYADRLKWTDAAGQHECRWDEVAEVYRVERITNRSFRYTLLRLVLADGRQVQFDHTLGGYNQLADQVQARTAEHLLPAKQRALDGPGAEFGPVTLSRAAVTIGGETFPWDEVEQYTICNGSLVAFPRSYQGHAGKEVALSAVPNYPVLLHLLRVLGKEPTPPNLSILFRGRGR